MIEFGLDKILIVVLLVGLVAGPERLLAWSRSAGGYVREVRRLYAESKGRIVSELDDAAPDWRELDPRRIDPRRIVRDALREPGGDVVTAGDPVPSVPVDATEVAGEDEDQMADPSTADRANDPST